jgi:hypothetical protein
MPRTLVDARDCREYPPASKKPSAGFSGLSAGAPYAPYAFADLHPNRLRATTTRRVGGAAMTAVHGLMVPVSFPPFILHDGRGWLRGKAGYLDDSQRIGDWCGEKEARM